ncbi:MAG: hypothetical protein ACLQUY_22190 [Ktedonobacterales bacterium]
MNTMNTIHWVRISRSALFTAGMLSLVEAAGLGLHIAPFTGIWPLGDASAVDLYLGAYMAAIGSSLLWISISGELRAAVAGGITLTVAYAGLAITWFVLSEGATDSRHLRTAALLCAIASVVSAGIAWRFRRFPLGSIRPLPRLLYVSFAGFALLLALVGGAVLLRMPNVFPLELSPVAAALVGCSFLGSATFFLYALAFPIWQNAHAQLWGFLAYDLVLIVPLTLEVKHAAASERPALLLNLVVLVYSGAVAIYYLLIARATRVWTLQAPGAGSKVTSGSLSTLGYVLAWRHKRAVRTKSRSTPNVRGAGRYSYKSSGLVDILKAEEQKKKETAEAIEVEGHAEQERLVLLGQRRASGGPGREPALDRGKERFHPRTLAIREAGKVGTHLRSEP